VEAGRKVAAGAHHAYSMHTTNRDYILDARQVALYTSLMRRLFPISIGFLGFFLELVAYQFGVQVLKGLVVGKLDGALFLNGSLLLPSRHLGDLPC
jgi:hypothetical protein